MPTGPIQHLCPFNFGEPEIYNEEKRNSYKHGPWHTPPVFNAEHPSQFAPWIPPSEPSPEYDEAMQQLDIAAVQKDLTKLMTTSQAWWPADYGNYGERWSSYTLLVIDGMLLTSFRTLFHPFGLALLRKLP